MPLDAGCQEFEGLLLYVRPFYGWGWWAYDESGWLPYTQDQAAGPAPFHLRIACFYEYNGAIQGAVGRIEEAGHEHDGLHAAFYLHDDKPADFTDNIASYNIQLGPDLPELITRSPDDDDWPLWKFSGRPVIGGAADIGVDEEKIARYDRRVGFLP